MTSRSPLLGHLQALHSAAGSVQDDSVQHHGAGLGRLLQLDLDIRSWEDVLARRPEIEQLTSARRELARAIYAASAGFYVHAYAGLRLFLELSFAAVYFSANELYRRKWVADRKDFSWNRALDETEGVLAVAFVSEFSRTAADDAPKYAANASTSYRHCSQFVHGKLAVTKDLPEQIEFKSDVIADWLMHSTQSATAVLYLIYARYGDEVVLNAESKLGVTLEQNFSHLRHVRARLGLPVEGIS